MGKTWVGNSAFRGSGSRSGPEIIFLQRPRRAIGKFWTGEAWSVQFCPLERSLVSVERGQREQLLRTESMILVHIGLKRTELGQRSGQPEVVLWKELRVRADVSRRAYGLGPFSQTSVFLLLLPCPVLSLNIGATLYSFPE